MIDIGDSITKKGGPAIMQGYLPQTGSPCSMCSSSLTDCGSQCVTRKKLSREKYGQGAKFFPFRGDLLVRESLNSNRTTKLVFFCFHDHGM